MPGLKFRVLFDSDKNEEVFRDILISDASDFETFYHAIMKSFVYDPINGRMKAELDENNYATFYEYNNEGQLIRVKKETESGIVTLKESRSSMLKK